MAAVKARNRRLEAASLFKLCVQVLPREAHVEPVPGEYLLLLSLAVELLRQRKAAFLHSPLECLAAAKLMGQEQGLADPAAAAGDDALDIGLLGRLDVDNDMLALLALLGQAPPAQRAVPA